MDKGFKPQAFHATITTMKGEFRIIVIEANMTNYWSVIHKRWARIEKVKELSGIDWDNRVKMIIMRELEYKNFIKIHIYFKSISMHAFQ